MIRFTKPKPEEVARRKREAARRKREAALADIGDVDDYAAFEFYEAFIADAGDR